jgi:hypothetical protein
MHRVAVLGDGFAYNGKTYPSLSKVAFAITGTRWNGPRFFGLRHKKKENKALGEARMDQSKQARRPGQALSVRQVRPARQARS